MSTQKVAFITGANRGIGLETARQLGKIQGIHVIIGSRDLAKGQAAAEALRAEGADVEAVRFDITRPEDYREIFEFLDKKFGKLDILINNAGIAKEDFFKSTVTTVSPAVLRETFETNFFGAVELTQTLLPLIKKAPEGRIVNLSSILGSLTLHADPKSPIAGSKAFAYNASKAALNAFTIHLAHELRRTKIKVNSAHPGWVKTEMGTEAAPMDIPDGARTSVALATLPADGPTGAYIHLGETLPW